KCSYESPLISTPRSVSLGSDVGYSLMYDYIEIHDGNTETADLLGKHCSNIAPAPIISSGHSLRIKFVSDYAHQGAGFSLRYEIYKTDLSSPFSPPRPTTLPHSPLHLIPFSGTLSGPNFPPSSLSDLSPLFSPSAVASYKPHSRMVDLN
ncbi:unnamed protein product, partial [Arctogadus glacialis]